MTSWSLLVVVIIVPSQAAACDTHVAVSRCTGTIIRPSIILTAGHCVNYEPEFKFTLFDISVYQLSCSKIAVSECPKINVHAFISYGDLTYTGVKFDIALIFIRPKLSATIQLPPTSV